MAKVDAHAIKLSFVGWADFLPMLFLLQRAAKFLF
jgi:hypothetical protein